MKKYKYLICSFLFLLFASALVYAAPVPIPNINIGVSQTNDPAEISTAIQVMLLLTVLSLAPSLMIMVTSFTRIVIVLSFTRTAIGTQNAPPTQLIIGLGIFLTFFIMSPVFNEINTIAIQPLVKNEISQEVAFERGIKPLREFMFRQVRKKDLTMMVHLSKSARPKNRSEIQLPVLISAFIVSELKTAFQMGFAIFIPFLVLDVVIASLLMSMGMMMLPPVMISMPFKILLFVMVDGWNLIARSLVMSFN